MRERIKGTIALLIIIGVIGGVATLAFVGAHKSTPQQSALGSQNNCDPNYTPCIPNTTGNALNCSDIRIEVRVVGTDHNHFDADHDGYGCEAYK